MWFPKAAQTVALLRETQAGLLRCGALSNSKSIYTHTPFDLIPPDLPHRSRKTRSSLSLTRPRPVPVLAVDACVLELFLLSARRARCSFAKSVSHSRTCIARLTNLERTNLRHGLVASLFG